MSDTAKPRRVLRRQFWNSSNVQLRFVLFAMLGSAVLASLISLTVFGGTWALLLQDTSMSGSGKLPETVFSETGRRVLAIAGGLLVLFMAIGGLVSIFVSHRVAGPLYRMNRILKDPRLRQGDLGRLRHGDALKDFFDDFKGFVGEHQALEARHDDLKATAADIARRLDQGAPTAEEARSMAHRLEEAIDESDREETEAA